MNRADGRLLEFRRDVYSQAGEDGVIGMILETLPATDHWCVEFGAWDGEHLSNTRHLIESHDYSAVLIESSRKAFQGLERRYSGNPKVITVNKSVGFTAADSLDRILETTPIPRDFDFLSIDIDGNDYHAWQAVSAYRPKVVCIEFNPTIPTEVTFVQRADPAVKQGSSLASIVDLATAKGYELVAVLSFNAFFVVSEFYRRFNIADNRPQVLREDLSAITYLFSGFDGTIYLRGLQELPWHRISLRESKMQHLPAALRKYPLDYTPIETLFGAFLNSTSLWHFLTRLGRWVRAKVRIV